MQGLRDARTHAIPHPPPSHHIRLRPPGPPPAGPAIFLPAPEVAAPEEDVRLIDATRLKIMQRAQREEDAEGLMGGVTAFSRQRKAARAAGELGERKGEGGEQGVGQREDGCCGCGWVCGWGEG